MENWMRFGLPGNFAYSPELWMHSSMNFLLKTLLEPRSISSLLLGIDYIQVTKDYVSKVFHAHAKDTEIILDGKYQYGLFGRQIDPIPWNRLVEI